MAADQADPGLSVGATDNDQLPWRFGPFTLGPGRAFGGGIGTDPHTHGTSLSKVSCEDLLTDADRHSSFAEAWRQKAWTEIDPMMISAELQAAADEDALAYEAINEYCMRCQSDSHYTERCGPGVPNS